MKKYAWVKPLALLVAILLITQPSDAEAQVTVQSAGGGDLNVTIIPPNNFVTWGEQNPTSTIGSFTICWMRVGQWGDPCNIHRINWPTTTHIGTRQIGGLTLGKKYYVVGKCYCQAPGGGWDLIEIGHQTFTYGPPPPPPPPTLTRSDLVRIRNLSTNQCAYIDLNGFIPRHWTCWPDPNMRFYRDVYSDGLSTFRDVRSGRCLWAGQPAAPMMGSNFCGWPGTRFVVWETVTGSVYLWAPQTGNPFGLGDGGCAYAGGGDGDLMLKEACNGNQRLLFVLDPA